MAASLGLAFLLVGACGAEEPEAPVLTIYSGRSEALVRPLIDEFSKLTGISVQVKWGDTAELAATIQEEGANTRADVFYAQEPGALGALQDRFIQLPATLLDRVEPQFRSPQGKWVGISGRARTVVYNTQKVKETDLPESVMGFTDPKWKGRLGWAPTNASFQVMVTAMRSVWGEEKTRQWLQGIKANAPKVYPNNTTIVQAVGAGEIDAGFVNHYYLFRFLQEKGEDFPARNYHPKNGDPGALVMVSGVGVLAASKKQETALKFVDFLLSSVGQQYFASQTYEYPVVKGVATQRLLVPLSQVQAPAVELRDLADLRKTLDLLRDVGVL
ncbi:MAG: iron ABC transporter substrate-binding protein [Chloroflexi bacterium]|nr:iron ABC transporter substrate-binding protein [Chloroflexota bacterium]